MAEDNKKLLTEAEAQQIAEKFLLAKYYESKIDFSDNQLINKDDAQIYQLQGKITMQSRGSIDHFVMHKTANKHDFKIVIDAYQGRVLSYEFI